ncbi:MAG: HK97 gp10 family phage protein [Prevotellaceae bacterium]|nr:HK97 gp10 family phage protein [Candidatus Colivivens equi]
MKIVFKETGNFKKFDRYMEHLLNLAKLGSLDKYGKMGVEALKKNTPRDSGDTAESWGYVIERSHHDVKIVFTNSNVKNGVNIAVILQYGHATRNGGWVEGVDYINPSLQPVFEKILNDLEKEVKKT